MDQHFGEVLKVSSPDDPDDDGRSNRQEWLELTDPNQSDSPFRSEFQKTEEGFQLTLSKAVHYGLTFEKRVR